MLDILSAQEMQDFIQQHADDDINSLVLKYKNVLGVPVSIVADQISGRKKAKDKIPLYYNQQGIVYPPKINLEQSSSEATARYKSDLSNKLLVTKDSCVDLTGGFGIDSFFFHEIFKEMIVVEPNTNLLTICKHNHRKLGAENVTYINSEAQEFLETHHQTSSLIYIDPSRRNSSGRKVYSLADCEPPVVKLVESIFKRTDHLLLKASPLLDIQRALNELQSVRNVFVISVQNDCKELLLFAERSFRGEPSISAINIEKDTDTFTFYVSEEHAVIVPFSEPLEFIYEPNASILKAGAFKSIAQRYDLYKLHPNTHLYTSSRLKKDFPGRIFKILGYVKPRSTHLKEYFVEAKANIMVRNYPQSVQDLKRATGLKDGGERFLIGFTGMNKKFLVAAEKVI